MLTVLFAFVGRVAGLFLGLAAGIAVATLLLLGFVWVLTTLFGNTGAMVLFAILLLLGSSVALALHDQ